MHSILVVDDDKLNLALADKLLSTDYEVNSVNSGKAAFEFLKDHKPSLILLDLQLPDMDGFSIMEVIRENPYTSRIPVIFLTADRSEKTEEKCFQLGAFDYISKPFVPSVMKVRIKRVLDLEDSKKHLEQIVQSQLEQLNNLQQDIIVTMANLIESRDGTTGEHVKRTSTYVSFILKCLKDKNLYTKELTPRIADFIKKAAPMHDIGKITISDSILQKTSTLTEEEYQTMKTHALNGGKLILKNKGTLGSDDFVKVAYEMATYHHENWDGSGYPEGLKGTEIPLPARILTIADVFDALSSKRSYKESLDFKQIVELMKKERGIKFEPEILDAFLSKEDVLETVLLFANPEYDIKTL